MASLKLILVLWLQVIVATISRTLAACPQVKARFEAIDPVVVSMYHTSCGTTKPQKVDLSDSAATLGDKTVGVADGTLTLFKFAMGSAAAVNFASSAFVIEDKNAEITCKINALDHRGDTAKCTCNNCANEGYCRRVTLDHYCNGCTLQATHVNCGTTEASIAVVETAKNLTQNDDRRVENYIINAVTGSTLLFDYFHPTASAGGGKMSLGTFIVKQDMSISCTVEEEPSLTKCVCKDC